MFWAIIGPEFLLSIAIGQYASARRSVKRFRELGYPQWTIRHAFFADMGGFILHPKDSTPFVVNARQLFYLVENKYLDLPTITAEEIWTKSRADTLSKLLTLAQANWLILQLLGRAITSLPSTTLELYAAAIVFCTLGTFICWLQKPSDVKKGIILETSSTTERILRDAGSDSAAPYRHTPLDFVAKESFTIGYDLMRVFKLRFDDRERPLQRFPNDRFPDISTVEKFGLFCWTTAYATLHLIAWHWAFPTPLESLLWKISSLLILGATVLFWVFETIAARHRFGRWDKYLIWMRLKKIPIAGASKDEENRCGLGVPILSLDRTIPIKNGRTASVSITPVRIGTLDAFEQEQKNAKPMLAWEVAIIFPVVVLYATARAYMIVEVFISLREMPAEVYQTIQWAQAIPHW